MPPKRKPKPESEYPEPGTGEIGPALPRGDDKIPSWQIRDEYVSYEGLGFCVYTLIPSSMLEDKQLRILWATARQALQDIVEFLEQVQAPTDRRRIKSAIDYKPFHSEKLDDIGDDVEEEED